MNFLDAFFAFLKVGSLKSHIANKMKVARYRRYLSLKANNKDLPMAERNAAAAESERLKMEQFAPREGARKPTDEGSMNRWRLING